jgi:hypothetical protein
MAQSVELNMDGWLFLSFVVEKLVLEDKCLDLKQVLFESVVESSDDLVVEISII